MTQETPEQIKAQRDELLAEVERLRDAVEEFNHRLSSWAEAYPLSIFPEPDYKAAHAVLLTHGMTLDRISAGNMRHVVVKLNELFQPVRALTQTPKEPKP